MKQKAKGTKGPGDKRTPNHRRMQPVHSAARSIRRRFRSFCPFVLLSLCPLTTRADNWAPNLTTTATWNDNATNANAGADELAGLQTEAVIIASERFSLGRADSLHPGLHFSGEWWPKFNGLLRGSAGARLEWRHKFGLGALAPTVSLELGADQAFTREHARRGTGSLVNLSLRKRFNDQWRGAVWHEWTDHAARGAVFDRRGSETALELGRDLNDVARLTLTLRHRDGDVVSYATPPRPDLVALARHRTDVDTFGRPMVAYSIDARTIGGKLAVIRAVNEASALIAGYEYRETERAPLRYVNHLVSLALVHQF